MIHAWALTPVALLSSLSLSLSLSGYLVGGRGLEVVRKLFKGIHWSTSLVYRDQVSTAYKLELSVSPYKCLPVLIDSTPAVKSNLAAPSAMKAYPYPYL